MENWQLVCLVIVLYLFGRKLEKIHDEITDLSVEFDKRFNPRGPDDEYP